MGELPPSCSTPQGPDVPRAFRPGFPRVDSSRTSSALSSRSASFPFNLRLWFSPLHSSSLSRGVSPPFAFSVSFPFLPLPCVRFSPVLSSSLHGPIQVPPRISPPLFPHVSLRFLPLPSPSTCVYGSLQFSPLRSSHRFQVRSPPLSTHISSG